MKVFFRNENGEFISRKEFCAKRISVTIRAVTIDAEAAHERLEQLKAVSVETIVQLCAACMRIESDTISDSANLYLDGDGTLNYYRQNGEGRHMGSHKSFCDMILKKLSERIEQQQKICNELDQNYVEF